MKLTPSLHDAQDEEYQLGLVRKDFLLTQNSIVDKDKTPEGEPSPGADIVEGGQGVNLSRGSVAEPDLEQNQSTQSNPSRTDLRTGSRTDPEPISPIIQERVESVSVDPLTPRP